MESLTLQSVEQFQEWLNTNFTRMGNAGQWQNDKHVVDMFGRQIAIYPVGYYKALATFTSRDPLDNCQKAFEWLNDNTANAGNVVADESK